MSRKLVLKDKSESPSAQCELLAPLMINNFLDAVIANAGNITAACKKVTDTEYKAHALRIAVYTLEKKDPEFAERFREAQRLGLEVLEDEARRRAFEGVERVIYHQGVAVDTAREYANSLICFLLKGGKPEKYKDRVEHTGDPNAPMCMDIKSTPLIDGFLKGLEGEKPE